MKWTGVVSLCAVSLMLFASCHHSPTPHTMTISAAISLKNVLDSLRTEYVQTYPSADITFNLGASGALELQIENGAPVDLFISAAATYIDKLEQKRLILPGSRVIIAENRLVIIVPSNDSSIHSAKDLLNGNIHRVALGDPKSVPAGSYAAEALKKLHLFDALTPKFIYGNDVRQVLTYVETSNVDAGIVYTTDALESKQIRIAVELPDSLHEPITYPAAIIGTSKNQKEAKTFLNFLSSDSGQKILAQFGFHP